MTAKLETIWSAAVAHGRADFLVGMETPLSYAGLERLVSSWCALFDTRGLAAGDRIIIVSSDEVGSITAYLAALLDGIVPIMLTPESAAPKIEAICASIEPSLVIADKDRSGESWTHGAHLLSRETGKSIRAPLAWGRRAPTLSASLGLPDAGRPPRLPSGDDEIAYILFTSGTTSSPTGVMISRGALLAQLETMISLFAYGSESRIFNAMVLAHADGMVQGPILALACGAAVVRPGTFSVHGMEDWLNAVRRHRATHFITVPTVFAMIDRYAAHNDYFDAPEFVAMSSVAAKLDTGLWARLEQRFGRPVLNQYGLTETVVSVIYAGRWPGMGAVGSIGIPVNCEARIVDASGREATQPNSPGELQLTSSQLFSGYWKDPERTRASLTAGWFKTGDVAQRRADGSYEVLGRLKNVIMSGGFLIRPEEIDEVLRGHPMVAESATVAIASADFEEIPMSLVVLDSPIGEADLTHFCRKALEPQKVPKRIIAVDGIPRGDAGKPQLTAIRALIADRLASEQTATPAEDVATAVIEVCARVFRVDRVGLSPRSTPAMVAGWDSFTQIELILEIERTFGASIPASKVAGIRSVGDLIAATQAARR